MKTFGVETEEGLFFKPSLLTTEELIEVLRDIKTSKFPEEDMGMVNGLLKMLEEELIKRYKMN